MSNPLDDYKKFKIFNELFIAMSTAKIVFKDLNNPQEHQTFSFIPNGIIDIHKTKEGTKKEYESLGQFDLLKTVANMASDPKNFIEAIMNTLQSLKKVDFTESEFEHLTIVPMMDKEQLLPLLKFNKKKVEVPLEAADDLNFLNNRIPWKDARQKIKDNALVLNEDSIAGYVFKKDDQFLYLPAIDVTGMPLVQFFENAMNMSKFDRKISSEENEQRKKIMSDLMKENSDIIKD